MCASRSRGTKVKNIFKNSMWLLCVWLFLFFSKKRPHYVVQAGLKILYSASLMQDY